MGAAKDEQTCGTTIAGQVWAPIANVGKTALLVASLGSSAAAAPSSGLIADLKDAAGKLKTLYQAVADQPPVKQMIELGKRAHEVKTTINVLQNLDPSNPPEDLARNAAELAALFDPTGTAATVAAFTYPKCSIYFPPQLPDGTVSNSAPRRLAEMDRLYDVEVWGINKNHDVYRWNGVGFDYIPGKLKSIAVGDREVWGINENQDVYWWNGEGFDYVPGAKLTSIVVVDGEVWGTSLSNVNGNPVSYAVKWNSNARTFDFVDNGRRGSSIALGRQVAGNERQVWLIDNSNGIPVNRQTGNGFTPVGPFPLSTIAVGDRDVWGINATNQDIYRWNWNHMIFDLIPGKLRQIAVSDREVWGIDEKKDVYRWNGTKFDNVPGSKLASLVVVSDEVWAIDMNGDIVRWEQERKKFEKAWDRVTPDSGGQPVPGFDVIAVGR
jgi:hypothetical protein